MFRLKHIQKTTWPETAMIQSFTIIRTSAPNKLKYDKVYSNRFDLFQELLFELPPRLLSVLLFHYEVKSVPGKSQICGRTVTVVRSVEA